MSNPKIKDCKCTDKNSIIEIHQSNFHNFGLIFAKNYNFAKNGHFKAEFYQNRRMKKPGILSRL